MFLETAFVNSEVTALIPHVKKASNQVVGLPWEKIKVHLWRMLEIEEHFAVTGYHFSVQCENFVHWSLLRPKSWKHLL